MREQKTNNKHAGDPILRWCNADDPRGAGAHPCRPGASLAWRARLHNVGENPLRRQGTTRELHAERSGLESNTQQSRCEAPTKRCSQPNLPSDKIVDAAVTRQKWTERRRMCTSFQRISQKKKKINWGKKKICFHLWDILMETKHLTAFVAQVLRAVPVSGLERVLSGQTGRTDGEPLGPTGGSNNLKDSGLWIRSPTALPEE